MAKKSLAEKHKQLSEAYAHAILDLNKREDEIVKLRARIDQVFQERLEIRKQRDALKKVAKEVLFVLEEAGLYPELQEQLQLAICNLPKEAAKQNPVAENPPSESNKSEDRMNPELAVFVVRLIVAFCYGVLTTMAAGSILMQKDPESMFAVICLAFAILFMVAGLLITCIKYVRDRKKGNGENGSK